MTSEEPLGSTPLAGKLAARIARDGPIGVDDYMQACLQDPEHGYYRRQPAIGRAGDFVTAPEISQVFGELIGLWCAVVWQQMGSPQRCAPHRAGTRTRHADARCLARRAPRSGIPRRAARRARREQHGTGACPARDAERRRRPIALERRNPARHRPGHRHRQRVHRHAAACAVGLPGGSLARALRRPRCRGPSGIR